MSLVQLIITLEQLFINVLKLIFKSWYEHVDKSCTLNWSIIIMCFYKCPLFFLLSCRHLIMAQPAKVLYVLTSASAQRPKETDLKLAESIVSRSVSVAAVNKPESESTVPAGDQERPSTEGELKQLLMPTLSSSCTPDGVSDLHDESVGNSESPDVREQLPVSEHETNEQETKSEWTCTSSKQCSWQTRGLHSYKSNNCLTRRSSAL